MGAIFTHEQSARCKKSILAEVRFGAKWGWPVHAAK